MNYQYLLQKAYSKTEFETDSSTTILFYQILVERCLLL